MLLLPPLLLRYVPGRDIYSSWKRKRKVIFKAELSFSMWHDEPGQEAQAVSWVKPLSQGHKISFLPSFFGDKSTSHASTISGDEASCGTWDIGQSVYLHLVMLRIASVRLFLAFGLWTRVAPDRKNLLTFCFGNCARILVYKLSDPWEIVSCRDPIHWSAKLSISPLDWMYLISLATKLRRGDDRTIIKNTFSSRRSFLGWDRDSNI